MSEKNNDFVLKIAERHKIWSDMLEQLVSEGVERLDIWNGAKNEFEKRYNHRACLYLLPKRDARRGTFIICAGGAFLFKSPNEAKPVSELFNARGFNAAILDYTVNADGPMPGAEIPAVREAAGADALRAIRYLRANAEKLGVNPEKIAIGGFSAGGRVSQYAAFKYDFGNPDSSDYVERASSRPDAVMLMYGAPAYTTTLAGYHQYNMKEQHRVSDVDFIRNIRSDCPPVFIFQTNEDDPRHALSLAWELASRGLPHEVHTFSRGNHGGGLFNGCDAYTPNIPHTAQWSDLALGWLDELSF